MPDLIATARAFPNIALIKYWGNRDTQLRLPVNSSLSFNLHGLHSTTTVHFDPTLSADQVFLNDNPASPQPFERVVRHLDHIRHLAGLELHARVVSHNDFPTGAGVASSASAFAALTLAACAAVGLDLSERQLSTIARLGSGSASRSIPGGFVEWHAGEDHDSSFAESIAAPGHWDLVDLIAVVSDSHKNIGSTGGHAVAPTSPLQAARVADAPRRLDECRVAILRRDFDALASIAEHDTLQMHAVMLTSLPSLMYWEPSTLHTMKAVRQWRAEGYPVFFSIDAGPNVHVITNREHSDGISRMLQTMGGIRHVLRATPGGPAYLLDDHLSAPLCPGGD